MPCSRSIRTLCALTALLALAACDDPKKPPGDSSQSETQASEGPRAIRLPEVSRTAESVSPDHLATLWIAPDGIWLGRSTDAAKRILSAKDAKLDAQTEWLEPLAVALHDLEPPPPPENGTIRMLELYAGPRNESMRIMADKHVDAKTLRRVVTVARGVGYGPFYFSVSPDTALKLASTSPVSLGMQAYEQPLRVALGTKGELTLAGKAMDAEAFTAELTRQLEFRDRRCVLLDANDDVDYATWLAAAARLAELEVDCLTVASPLAPADAPPPPPPPPPPPAGEETNVEPPKPEAPKEPLGRAELLRWWDRAAEVREEQDAKECANDLAKARERLKSATEPNAQLYVAAAGFEEECGSAEEARALRVQRTSSFPNDWKAWQALGIGDFGPLWPDPERGKRYNPDVPADERRTQANLALASFEKAAELAPTERDPLTWSAMALIQRSLTYEAADDGTPAAAAQLDTMEAWRYQKKACDLEKRAVCPKAPMTEDEYTALKRTIGG